ncbi:MAG: SUMF1/EgtB/PvdO family nonheme iron enzyme [Anaerolineales bacterium]|jgi:formylglycine-generating enzyme required for sulfatase activity
MQKIHRVFCQIVLIGIPLLMVASCAPPAVIQPAISVATADDYQAALTAVDAPIKLTKKQSTESEVQPGENVNVWVDDFIEVGDESRAFLKFPKFLDLELYRNAQLLLTDARLESGEAISVYLNQKQGHIGVSLKDGVHTRVTLKTEDATIKVLESGTEFIVCAAPGVITCVAVLKGAVEVTGQGKKEVVKDGKASYIATGQAPVPAICAPQTIFQDWKVSMRESAGTPDIAEVVASFPQEPCISTEMAEIGAGVYQIGSDTGNEFHSAVRDISLDKFWIDKYEVTNVQYQYYLDQVNGQQPAVWPAGWDSAGWGHPVRGVTWDQAAAYCSWAGKRLPSEAEWEVAGRGPGPDAPVFPWGNDSQAGGEIIKLPLEETYIVGAFPFNVSPFGVYDMAGNVWEWVGEPYDNVQAGYQILRGGRFGFIKDLTYRERSMSDDERFVTYTGFRCATNQLEEE